MNSNNGLCFYSGVQLDMPYEVETEFGVKAGSMNPNVLSFDRYDSNVPYIKHNIRLCTYQVNIAKNSYTSEQFIAMCALVAAHSV